MKERLRHVQMVLRIVMVFSLVYGMSSLAFFPLIGSITKSEHGAVYPEAAFELENGMGGGVVSITPVSLELEPAISGVPEPAEYSKPQMLLYTSYAVQRGDIISGLAEKFGLNQDTLISVNRITNSRLLQIGQVLQVPNQDGIRYTVQRGDTLASIAERYRTTVGAIQTVNELFPDIVDALQVNTKLFIPGARLDQMNLQEINGDLFIWPLRSYITSSYGYRLDPISGRGRQFHSGIDIGAPMGTPIKAAMSGRVSAVGYSESYGNYVVISHYSGYRSMYGHMSVIRVKSGAFVVTGERIGDVGSTGHSTGPHLHFTIYKDGVTVNPRTLIK
ncbi:MAG: M23 family metallopeptidase [Treponema sp.]|jgi:murein DD-endopeptidase MepM/ murein hydrolase activator NlpD|nr:M23 family metallopeptidase [Treponema sp.]